MATSSIKSVLVTLFIFAMVLSPMIPTEATRLNTRELLQTKKPFPCPDCMCCSSAPPAGSCCACCEPGPN
ncbi:cryptdin protein-related [Euphorbia peplus]|nr:cryptdin protein-related [Euphorbia peplus]